MRKSPGPPVYQRGIPFVLPTPFVTRGKGLPFLPFPRRPEKNPAAGKIPLLFPFCGWNRLPLHDSTTALEQKNRPPMFCRFQSAPVPGSDLWAISSYVANRSPAKRQAFKQLREKKCSGWWFHGVLHLFGFDHETSARGEKQMFRLQNAILKNLFNSRIASMGLSWDAFIVDKGSPEK